MNLDEFVPRSPKDILAEFAHLPRMLDKARAYKKRTLGEYIYPCPIDVLLLNFLGLNVDEFAEKAGELDDISFENWLKEIGNKWNVDEKNRLNRSILKRKVGLLKSLRYTFSLRKKLKLSEWKITTWPDYVDWEEGRI
jgi:hypothetical protein